MCFREILFLPRCQTAINLTSEWHSRVWIPQVWVKLAVSRSFQSVPSRIRCMTFLEQATTFAHFCTCDCDLGQTPAPDPAYAEQWHQAACRNNTAKVLHGVLALLLQLR